MGKIIEMTDDEIFSRLMDEKSMPERTLVIKRLNIPVTIKALNWKELVKIDERCTVTIDGKKVRDVEKYNAAVVVAATVRPNWGDPKLTSALKLSSGEEVVKRKLTAGEFSMLSDAVLDLSGFGDGIEEVKN